MQREYLVVNFNPVQADALAAFEEHMKRCPKCVRWRTASPRQTLCVRGMMRAGQAAEVLHAIGVLAHVDADQSGPVPS